MSEPKEIPQAKTLLEMLINSRMTQITKWLPAILDYNYEEGEVEHIKVFGIVF